MKLRRWEDLPENMRTPEVRPYYDILKKKGASLSVKRAFDIVLSLLLLILLSPVFLILALAIKADSRGPVFYRQTRVTQYGREFRIHKFRSMVVGADRGALVTVGHDGRVTRVGRFIRGCRLDEICQLIDVLEGSMTFVGTRPEVPRYVEKYMPEMMATLLLPAGITSEASIFYRDEAELLEGADDVDGVYINKVLPGKMKYNLEAIEKTGVLYDMKVMISTVFAVFRRE